MQKVLAHRGRVYSDHATYFIPRTPSTAQLTEFLADTKLSTLIPISSFTPLPPNKSGKFTILYAGTFNPTMRHIPWLLETPFEFLDGLKTLAEAVSKLENAELIIRLRERSDNRDELDLEMIKKELSSYPNIKFENEGSFTEALTKSDLLVANLSTTIDEALQHGRPVLLHSGTQRYQHLEPDANAVYISSPNLDKLLKSIMIQQKPLTAEELKDYAWISCSPAALTRILTQ